MQMFAARRNRANRAAGGLSHIIGYIGLMLGCFAIAMIAGWTSFANQIDSDMYDWMFRLNPPAVSATRSVVLAIDDATLNAMHGIRNTRSIVAATLERLAPLQPALVAIDLILADEQDATEDQRLAAALRRTRNLILATDLVSGTWENPQPTFREAAVAVGHTLADEESPDGVTRQISLSTAENRERQWALALEAFRMERGSPAILESPDDLQIGRTLIPTRSPDRPLWIRYLRDGIPQISVKDFLNRTDIQKQVRNKAVFLGIYSNSAARDRVVTPFGDHVAGVEVNAQAFETLERADFFVDASNLSVLAFCAAVASIAGLVFVWLSGWPAYLAGAALLATAHLVPFWMFHHGIVFPYFAPLSAAWLTVAGAAIYQHFVVRGQLRRSEVERTRYRQAIHFVTHEMRTPLTAIQGSSELIGRYNLNDEKRKQIAHMINSESKRLARMIQTFLDVERLSDGQMELKNERFEAAALMESCLDRVRPLAERKSITLNLEGPIEGTMRGDRELMEYAIYNLLTNAVKYSSSNTEISVSSHPNGHELRLSIRDQGMGMDAKELKQIFERFYRTKRAEASGEKGSGIGLSIVDQIVQHHQGRMEVTSAPGRGSCFTVVVPSFAGDA